MIVAIFNWKLWRFDYTLRIIMLDDVQFGITAYGCVRLVCVRTFCRITYGYCINYATCWYPRIGCFVTRIRDLACTVTSRQRDTHTHIRCCVIIDAYREQARLFLRFLCMPSNLPRKFNAIFHRQSKYDPYRWQWQRGGNLRVSSVKSESNRAFETKTFHACPKTMRFSHFGQFNWQYRWRACTTVLWCGCRAHKRQ